MPSEVDKDVYRQPPALTPVYENKSGLPNVFALITNVFTYAVDKPVTLFHDWMESQRSKRRIYYYHRVFQRVPDLSQCLEDDVLCHYEAEMQWRRDMKVDRNIVRIMRDRYTACRVVEGSSADQNCAELKEQFTEVCKAYKTRYEFLGANGNAKKCLMKQKQRMIEERKAAAAEQNAEA
ncbi:PREDICTED: NADH dehydrogenase [ubiquinone] 1 beta subcomplex subunit 10 [Nanorana parkeri]|uniref:NADH dehydrogenase [ubiquinone] 1 beta subcomplex subunit 10 n=1 Tax=Nanorana parkeri TaxID=125878 RepID=UPI0008544E1C|nr:PREDICTED: NADH dehydrogenase [ubiquinone] 1 beta subcomplex subunit 10 [Nanorana parkeri]